MNPVRKACLPILILVSLLSTPVSAASARTQNFIVTTNSTYEFAQECANRFEESRHRLAVYWFGQPQNNFIQPVPCTVTLSPMAQGGVTSFTGTDGAVASIDCRVGGPASWLLADCIPHETLHMVTHVHWRSPSFPPRWVDEGLCSIIESDNTYVRHSNELVGFLQTGRGITTKRLWTMRDYPSDIMPLYAQGYSQVLFLFNHSGPKELIDFIDKGADESALSSVYGYDSCIEFQRIWLTWVQAGSPRVVEVLSPCDNGQCGKRRWRGTEWTPTDQQGGNQGTGNRPVPWTPPVAPKPLVPIVPEIKAEVNSDAQKLADCLKKKAELEAALKAKDQEIKDNKAESDSRVKDAEAIGSAKADSTINLPLVQAEADRLKRKLHDTESKSKDQENKIKDQEDKIKDQEKSKNDKPGLMDKLKGKLTDGAEFGLDHGWKFFLATVLGLGGWKLWAAYTAGKLARKRVARKIKKRRAEATHERGPFQREGDGNGEKDNSASLGRSATVGREFVQLFEQEQRNPLHDATFGRVFEQEAELVLEGKDEVAKGIVQQLLDRSYRRFANIHPVAIKEQ